MSRFSLLLWLMLWPALALGQVPLSRLLNGAERRWNKSTEKGLDALSDLELATAIGRLEESLIDVEWEWLNTHSFHSQYGATERCVGLIALAGAISVPYLVPDFYPGLVSKLELGPSLALVNQLHAKATTARQVLADRFAASPGRLRTLLLRYHIGELDLATETLDALLGIERSFAEFSLLHPQDYGEHTVYPWNRITDLAQSFYTKPREFYRLAEPRGGEVVWDLGCGHGRVLLYGAVLFPEVTFKGVDVVGPRLESLQRAAQRNQLKNVQTIQASVLEIDLSDGHHFYFFNPFPHLMPEVLSRLERVAQNHRISVYGHGVIEVRDMLSASQGWLYSEGNSLLFGRSR